MKCLLLIIFFFSISLSSQLSLAHHSNNLTSTPNDYFTLINRTPDLSKYLRTFLMKNFDHLKVMQLSKTIKDITFNNPLKTHTINLNACTKNQKNLLEFIISMNKFFQSMPSIHLTLFGYNDLLSLIPFHLNSKLCHSWVSPN
jgi:hypothetical protein